MTRALFALLLICVLVFPASADIFSDVENLTPEEAYLLMDQLQIKSFEGTPPEGVGGGFEIGVFNPSLKNLNNSLPAALDKFPVMVLFGGTWRWSFDERTQIGLGGAGGVTTTQDKSLTGDVEKALLGMGLFEFLVSYKPILEENFEGYIDLGLDYIMANYERLSTPSGSYTTLHTWDGSTMAYRTGIGAKIRFNPIFSIGGDLSYLSGKIQDLREAGTVDKSVPDVDLTGFLGKVGLHFHF